MRKIRVIIKRPGEKGYVTHISDTLENLQRTVGGYIETVTLAKYLVVICNDEGRINEMPYNCTIGGVQFFGTIILAGCEGENFGDCAEYEKIKRLFPHLFEEEKNNGTANDRA